MFDVGGEEFLLILLVALLLFGGQLPEVARSVGRSVGKLRRAFAEATGPLREIAEEAGRESES